MIAYRDVPAARQSIITKFSGMMHPRKPNAPLAGQEGQTEQDADIQSSLQHASQRKFHFKLTSVPYLSKPKDDT